MRKNETKVAAEELRPLLLDLVALSIQAKQAHWNVTGPLFAPLHALFDGLAEASRGWYDDVAERLRALGEPADGRIATVAKDSQVSEMPAGELEGAHAVNLLCERVEGLAARTHARLGRIGEADPVTQDLVIGVVHGLEKQAWMLRSQRG